MYTAVLSEQAPIVVERTFMAPRARVWKALTDPAQMRVWYFPELPDFRSEVGFETQFGVPHEGRIFLHRWRVTAVVPGQRIVYEWRLAGHPAPSLLTIELFEQMGMTWLRLTHEGIEINKDGFVERWRSLIGKSLSAYLRG